MKRDQVTLKGCTVSQYQLMQFERMVTDTKGRRQQVFTSYPHHAETEQYLPGPSSVRLRFTRMSLYRLLVGHHILLFVWVARNRAYLPWAGLPVYPCQRQLNAAHSVRVFYCGHGDRGGVGSRFSRTNRFGKHASVITTYCTQGDSSSPLLSYLRHSMYVDPNWWAENNHRRLRRRATLLTHGCLIPSSQMYG